MESNNNFNRDGNKARFLTKLSPSFTLFSAPASNLEGKVQVATLLKAAADESLTLSSVAARREVTRFLL
jgi:hypothetical protein